MTTAKQMEKRLLEMQFAYLKEPTPRKREEYRALHRRWVAAKSQLTLGDR